MAHRVNYPLQLVATLLARLGPWLGPDDLTINIADGIRCALEYPDSPFPATVPVGIAYDLLVDRVRHISCREDLARIGHFTRDVDIKEPLHLRCTIRNEDAHSNCILASQLLDHQLHLLSRLTLHSWKLVCPGGCRLPPISSGSLSMESKEFHWHTEDVQRSAFPRHLEAFYQAFSSGTIYQTGYDTADNCFRSLEGFLDEYFEPLFMRGLPEANKYQRKKIMRLSHPEPVTNLVDAQRFKNSLIQDIKTWGLTLAARVAPRVNAQAKITHSTAARPSMPLPQSSLINSNQCLVPPVAPTPTKTDTARLVVRFHVWGPPYLHRITAFPAVNAGRSTTQSIILLNYLGELCTIGDVLRAVFPPDMAEWIVQASDARRPSMAVKTDQKCWVTVHGLNLPTSTPLIWLYCGSIGWSACLDLCVRLPPQLVELPEEGDGAQSKG